MHVWVKPKLHIHIECGPIFSSSAPHLLHNGLSDSLIRWRCLLRVLCPVRRPVTTLDCVLLKDRNLALAPGQGPEINSQPCLWVLQRPRHHVQCWLTNQCLILLISCLETPKACSGPTNFRAQLSLVSSSVISFPCVPACPGTQYSPTACWVWSMYNDMCGHRRKPTSMQLPWYLACSSFPWPAAYLFLCPVSWEHAPSPQYYATCTSCFELHYKENIFVDNIWIHL